MISAMDQWPGGVGLRSVTLAGRWSTPSTHPGGANPLEMLAIS